MDILSKFAQTGYDTYSDGYSATSNGTGADAVATAGLVLFFMLIWVFFVAIIYVVVSLSLMQIFKKAGIKPWIAWVPFYNQWKLLELGGQQGFWAILTIVPIVQIVASVFTYIAMYHVGKKLEKEGAFVLLAIFLPIIWFIWLAVDKSKWNDQASPNAPSIA